MNTPTNIIPFINKSRAFIRKHMTDEEYRTAIILYSVNCILNTNDEICITPLNKILHCAECIKDYTYYELHINTVSHSDCEMIRDQCLKQLKK